MDNLKTLRNILLTYLVLSALVLSLRLLIDIPVSNSIFPLFVILGPMAFLGISKFSNLAQIVPFVIAFMIGSVIFFGLFIANQKFQWLHGIAARTTFSMLWVGIGVLALLASSFG